MIFDTWLSAHLVTFLPVATERVNRDLHMNECKGDFVMDVETIRTVLIGYGRRFDHNDDFDTRNLSAGRLLDLLIEQAKRYRKDMVVLDGTEKQVEGLVTAFVNYLGQQLGLDVGMYSQDLRAAP